jgi:hypothetical protein
MGVVPVNDDQAQIKPPLSQHHYNSCMCYAKG